MKKRILTVLLAFAMCLSLVACGGQSIGTTTTTDNADSSTEGSVNASANSDSSTTTSNADAVKVGFIYIGDDSEAYTRNFITAQTAISDTYGDAVECMAKYKVADDDAAAVTSAAEELIAADCDIIFATSYGFETSMVEVAAENPDVIFCQATGDNAAESGLDNYYNYMGEIYQGRYVSGIIAGMKLQELINDGTITADQAKIGYVAAFNFAEPISGYTAFYMGAASIVPDVQMEVMYANSWGDYETEKQATTAMIEDGCVIISQHSDTAGPADACEEAYSNGKTVFHVSYNDSMTDVAPNTSLGGCRINWEPFEVAAVGAVIDGADIEETIVATGANVDAAGADFWGGFGENWVDMLDYNTNIIAEGTEEAVDAAIASFSDGTLKATDVYTGNYTATNPFDDTDVINLAETPFDENGERSAPAFGYEIDSFDIK